MWPRTWWKRGARRAAAGPSARPGAALANTGDRKSTRLNSSHTVSSYAVFCLKKKNGTEAAVRSLTEKTPETIRGMVQRIVDERVADGQLDECELTLRDVQRIKDACSEPLLGA